MLKWRNKRMNNDIRRNKKATLLQEKEKEKEEEKNEQEKEQKRTRRETLKIRNINREKNAE